MAAAEVIGPEELWTEDCDVLWIRADLCDSRSKARYLAWSGKRGEGRRWSLDGEPFGALGLVDNITRLRVTKQWLRDQYGSPHWEDYPWVFCKPDDDGAVLYWRIEVAE
jgi:hypothetical protein